MAEQGPYPTLGQARKRKYTMLSQVPPEELEEFHKLFKGDAPRRCREWNCELPHDAPPGQLRRHEHANAGRTAFCGRVVERNDNHEVVRRCDGEVEMQAGCFVCTTCGRGSYFLVFNSARFISPFISRCKYLQKTSREQLLNCLVMFHKSFITSPKSNQFFSSFFFISKVVRNVF